MLLIGGLNFGGVAQSYSSRTTWDWSALWWDRSKFCRILERSQSLMFHVARCDDIWDRSRSLWWFHKWSNHVCNATRGKMKVCFGCWFKEFLWKLRIEWFALTGCLRFRFRAGKFFRLERWWRFQNLPQKQRDRPGKVPVQQPKSVTEWGNEPSIHRMQVYTCQPRLTPRAAGSWLTSDETAYF